MFAQILAIGRNFDCDRDTQVRASGYSGVKCCRRLRLESEEHSPKWIEPEQLVHNRGTKQVTGMTRKVGSQFTLERVGQLVCEITLCVFGPAADSLRNQFSIGSSVMQMLLDRHSAHRVKRLFK